MKFSDLFETLILYESYNSMYQIIEEEDCYGHLKKTCLK